MSPQAFFLVIVGLVRASRTDQLKINVGRGIREVPKLYQHEGCFSAGIIAGNFLGSFHNSHSAVDKCASLASKQGFAEFSLVNGGQCRGGHNLQETYLNTGTSTACNNGLGGKNTADIYSIKQTPSDCGIESFNKATEECQKTRQKETENTRLHYSLGSPSPKYRLPSLNRTQKEVFMILKNDSLDSHWIELYNSTIWKNLQLFKFFMRNINTTFETEGDYTRAYNFFVQRQFDNVHSDDQKYFRFQFQDANNPFRNLSELALWRDDGVFTDQRLAGSNPMSIQKVSWNPGSSRGLDWTELSQKLNPNFDWKGAIQDVLGMDISLSLAIQSGHIYVVYYPLYDGLAPVSPDLLGAFSPIAIFASKPSRRQLPNRLMPVAIQLNSSTDSAVFTPADSELWLKAKHVLQVADYAQAQVVEHLFKLHLYMEPICVCVHRQLSTLHPLHQLLKHHCRGLVGTNKFGYPFLIKSVEGSFENLLAVGKNGAVEMMSRAYRHVSWDDLDFLNNIRNRGIDDKEKLPYFPYRDDGELIHETISNMVNEYVDQYYVSHKEIRSDSELQSFAYDVSVQGSGKVKKFPSKITSKWTLKKHLTRIIWALSAQHSAMNYAADHIAALTSNMPTRLYNDDRVGEDHYGVYNLPRGFTCGRQAALAMTLASLHYDSLFDYALRLPDEKGRLTGYGHTVYSRSFDGFVKEEDCAGCSHVLGMTTFPSSAMKGRSRLSPIKDCLIVSSAAPQGKVFL